MIITVSERTDIPAFYSEWFYQRLKEGFVDVRNPFNEKQVTRISLEKEDVDAFIFTTKNPLPMFSKLDRLEGYPCLFQITITPYDQSVEKNVVDKHKIIEGFKYLSKRFGKNSCILRYDPIFLNDRYTIKEHKKAFTYLLKELHPYTDICIFSFVTLYKNTRKHQNSLKIKELTQRDVGELALMLSSVANKYNIKLQCCANKYDLSEYGITSKSCISNEILSNVFGYEVNYKQVTTKREHCSCITHRDIGAYNSCMHLCRYCYANYDEDIINETMVRHNKKSSLLIGELNEEDSIQLLQNRNTQLSLF